ncbi:MAG: autotransporter-associated beta strand repeat-containing protein, partial [Luteolibacter sp.]
NAGNIFGTGPVTINGLITRQSGSNNITGTNNQIWNGDWTIQGGSSGTLLLNLSGTIDLGSLSSATTNVLNANSATRTIYASGLGSIAGNIQDGSNSITKNFSMGTTDPAGWTGGSTLTLSGANIYTGTTSIRNGTLSISSIKNVGGGASNVGAPTNAANGTISIGAGPFTGGLLYTGTAQDTDRVINLAGGAGGATLTQSGTGLLKYATAMTATGLGSKTLTLQGSTAGTGEIGGAIVDNGTTGSTLLNTSFATAASTITLASVDGVVVGAAISGTGIAGGTTVTAINPTTKVVTLSANTTGAGSSGTTITVAGVANLTSVTKSGTGTWTLSGANTYSGNTTVTAGTLKTGLANAIPSGSGKGNVVLDGGPSAGTFDINGFDVGFNGLSGTTGAVSGKVVNNATGTNKTLTVGNNDATATFAGVIADNTSGSGTVALTKTGAGTQTLAGTNTYTGATIINGGILAISGSITSAVTVNNAGTLAGTGTIGGATTVKGGGTHAAGSSVGAVGTQIFSDNLTYASDTATSSIFAWDLNSSSTSSGFDKVTGAVGKTLTIDNSLALDPIFKIVIGTGAATGIADSGNTFWDSQQTWSTIFNGFGSIAGGFSNYQVVDSSGAAFSSVRGSFSVTGTSVSWSAVPEPSAALGGLLLGAGLLRRRRRTGIAGSSGLQGSRRQR